MVTNESIISCKDVFEAIAKEAAALGIALTLFLLILESVIVQSQSMLQFHTQENERSSKVMAERHCAGCNGGNFFFTTWNFNLAILSSRMSRLIVQNSRMSRIYVPIHHEYSIPIV